ncbi:MAG: PadR family transcriptional regulator [Candidatus Micrarchaeia archaeon]
MIEGHIKKFVSNEMIKFIVLHHFKSGKKYPYELYAHFSSASHPHMLELTKSDFYNIISSLEKQGFIKANSTIVHSDGRARKYYVITQRGRETLKSSSRMLQKATKEFLAFLRSEFND